MACARPIVATAVDGNPEAIADDRARLGRLYERNGVTTDEVVISDELIRTVVGDYTREAGVRANPPTTRAAPEAWAASASTSPHSPMVFSTIARMPPPLK